MSSKKLQKSRIETEQNVEARRIIKDCCKKKFQTNVRKMAYWLGTSDVNVHRWLTDTTVPAWVLLRILRDSPDLFFDTNEEAPDPYGALDQTQRKGVEDLIIKFLLNMDHEIREVLQILIGRREQGPDKRNHKRREL